MERSEIELLCYNKAEELIDKYFPNYIQEVAINKPESLDVEYNDDLPFKIEDEFRSWLAELWVKEVSKDTRPFDTIMNQHLKMTMVDTEYLPHLLAARTDAEKITLWEMITKSNHEQVTYYKGLLLEYTKKLMKTMIADFMEDVK